MKFLVVMKQYGYGCDYTIGCGKTYYEVEAESVDAVMEKIAFPEGREEPNCSNLIGDDKLKEVLIIPMENVVNVSLDKWTEEVEKEIKKLKDAELEEAERAELERLKSKYEK